MKEKPTGFDDGLKERYGRKKGVKNNFKEADLNNEKNFEVEKTDRKEDVGEMGLGIDLFLMFSVSIYALILLISFLH